MDPDLTAQLAPDITAVGTFQRRGDLSVAPGLTLWLCVCVCVSRLQGALTNERDYESVVMMRMRQAAERQKLIEQMQREDEEEAS